MFKGSSVESAIRLPVQYTYGNWQGKICPSRFNLSLSSGSIIGRFDLSAKASKKPNEHV